MTNKEVIKQLEAERDKLSSKQIKLNRIIEELKNLDKIEVEVILTKKPKRDYTKRKRSSNSNIEEKKLKVKELLNAGKLSKQQIAEKVGVHVSSIYNWFGSEMAKKACKELYKRHKCENCHEQPGSAWWDGKRLCKRCFAIKKKGEETVLRKERKDPTAYDESELTVDGLEDDE